MTAPPRIPACLVTGVSGTDKRSFVHALLAARPADEYWAVLDNDGGELVRDLVTAQLAVASINGCACCTGQVALQAGIAQLVRQSRPQRLIIVASGVAEPDALERALQQEDLARGISLGLRLCVAAPQRTTALPAPARELLQRQMAAADHVVVADAAATVALRAAGNANVLQPGDAIRLVLAGPASSASSRRMAS
jgi:G3E family GTPase